MLVFAFGVCLFICGGFKIKSELSFFHVHGKEV